MTTTNQQGEGLMTEEQVSELITAIRRIAYGGQDGPAGLEMLAMAIGGEGPGWGGLPSAISGAGDAVAEALREGLSEIGRAIEAAGSQTAAAIRDTRETSR
jgi:hypothetical protein